jgi:hypothetical protein
MLGGVNCCACWWACSDTAEHLEITWSRSDSMAGGAHNHAQFQVWATRIACPSLHLQSCVASHKSCLFAVFIDGLLTPMGQVWSIISGHVLLLLLYVKRWKVSCVHSTCWRQVQACRAALCGWHVPLTMTCTG